MASRIGYKGNDILEDKLDEFDTFVRAINKLDEPRNDMFPADINFDTLGKHNFSDDLVLGSIARNIFVPNISNYDVRFRTFHNYSGCISIWTKKVPGPGKRKYGLESNVYLISFPIGINHDEPIELEDKELFYANIKRNSLGSLSNCIRGIRIMRFIENIQDYEAALPNVQRGIEQVKKAYGQVSSQKR